MNGKVKFVVKQLKSENKLEISIQCYKIKIQKRGLRKGTKKLQAYFTKGKNRTS